ncbi:hypothetical protein PF003_g31832 [Phytophthora fragariae]|nr:hypothetical protein PF003_g31832 [Phytophthora fragariae]
MKGVSDTTGLKPLDSAGTPLHDYGLSKKKLRSEVTKQHRKVKTTPVHVLVQLPDQGQQGGENDQDSLQMHRQTIIELKRIQAQMELVMEALPHKNSKSYSDRELGQLELQRLEKDGLVFDVAPDENGTAFWSNEIQIEADAIGNEADLDAFITPYFSEVLDRYGMVFVNSERDQWLSRSPFTHKSADLKPRGFATHPAMFHARPEPDDGVQPKDGFKFRFGVAEKELFDCVILFESKLTISDAAFGLVIRYLESICPEGPSSAILFDTSSFWLIRSYKSLILKVENMMWIRKGSKELFHNFIMPRGVACLTNACSSLNVAVKKGNAFLGRGAFGRVFKVQQGRKELALKIVEECSVGRLYQEKEALENAQGTGLTAIPAGEVIDIHASTTDNADIGAALLLSPVGHPLPRPTTQEEVQDLFRLLWQLHAKGLVHGDPRVPNVIVSEGKPLWIDLVEVVKVCTVFKQVDAEILTRDILRLPYTGSLDPTLDKLINNYGHSSTQENINQLAEAVWTLRLPN